MRFSPRLIPWRRRLFVARVASVPAAQHHGFLDRRHEPFCNLPPAYPRGSNTARTVVVPLMAGVAETELLADVAWWTALLGGVPGNAKFATRSSMLVECVLFSPAARGLSR